MKAKQWFVIGGMFLAGLEVCFVAEGEPGQKLQKPTGALRSKPAAAAVTNAITSAELPVIMYIEKRGQTITVKAGPKSPVYSVKTTEGKTLFENLSGEQLRAQAPELHEFIKTSVAKGSGNSRAVLDARMSVTR